MLHVRDETSRPQRGHLRGYQSIRNGRRERDLPNPIGSLGRLLPLMLDRRTLLTFPEESNSHFLVQ